MVAKVLSAHPYQSMYKEIHANNYKSTRSYYPTPTKEKLYTSKALPPLTEIQANPYQSTCSYQPTPKNVHELHTNPYLSTRSYQWTPTKVHGDQPQPLPNYMDLPANPYQIIWGQTPTQENCDTSQPLQHRATGPPLPK